MTGALSTVAAGTVAALAVASGAASLGPPPLARRPVATPRAEERWTRLDAATTTLARRLRLTAPHPRARRRLAATLAFGLLMLVLLPPLGGLVLAGVWVQDHRARRRVRRERAQAVARALPDVVDLLLLCTSAGLSLPVAHPLVARRTDAPLGEALRASAETAAAGRPRADAVLEALAPLGDRSLRLGGVLVDHLRYGVPLAPGLERLGAELRLDRRRRAEEEARRVPVRLLGPLVTCVLPAFALLTVVPLLAASLRALPT